MISLVLFTTLIFTIEGGKSNYIKLESKLSSTSPKSTSVQVYHVIRLNTRTTLVILSVHGNQTEPSLDFQIRSC